MRILLVEDQADLMENYLRSIESYNTKIETVKVRSFGDLQKKLLTTNFDTAIVDMDLNQWPDNDEFEIKDGKQLCDMLQDTKNFSDIRSCIFLYTSQELNEQVIKNTSYTILDKFRGRDVVNRFQSSIIAHMTDEVNILSAVTLDAFNKYPISKKAQYYKKIINKDKGQARFKIRKDCLWASSNFSANNPEIICERSARKDQTAAIAHACYKELNNCILNTTRIPDIFWNFSSIDLFEEQKDYIKNEKFDNKFIPLFFKISYAQSIARYLTDLDEFSPGYNDLVKLLEYAGQSILRETHCKIIDIMLEQGEEESSIKKKLSGITDPSEFNIVDYFIGELVSHEEDSDIAQVSLTSKLDDKFLKREFSYKWLMDNGIKYKGTSFLYCISEYQSNLSSNIQPL